MMFVIVCQEFGNKKALWQAPTSTARSKIWASVASTTSVIKPK